MVALDGSGMRAIGVSPCRSAVMHIDLDVAPVEAAVLAVDVDEVEALGREHLDHRGRGERQVHAADPVSAGRGVLDGVLREHRQS